MMKPILALFLFLLLLVNSIFAQADPAVKIPEFDDPYCNTIKQLEAGETGIDYKAFRESFLESEQFKVANDQSKKFGELKKEMYAQMEKSNYKKIIQTTKDMLSIDYTSMLAHKILQQTYGILEDTVNQKKYHDIEFGLLNSIVKNGDGNSCETAWPVIQVEEEYFILQMVGVDLQRQTLIQKNEFRCDKMEVKTERGKKETYYFEVSKVFEGYKVMFGK